MREKKILHCIKPWRFGVVCYSSWPILTTEYPQCHSFSSDHHQSASVSQQQHPKWSLSCQYILLKVPQVTVPSPNLTMALPIKVDFFSGFSSSSDKVQAIWIFQTFVLPSLPTSPASLLTTARQHSTLAPPNYLTFLKWAIPAHASMPLHMLLPLSKVKAPFAPLIPTNLSGLKSRHLL